MARVGLKNDLGVRKKFRGIFVRTGRKAGFNGHSQETLLFKKIIDLETETMVADHVWFNFTKGFEGVEINEGIIIEFEARIKEYKKGYVNNKLKINQQKIDYKLSHPTKIRIATT